MVVVFSQPGVLQGGGGGGQRGQGAAILESVAADANCVRPLGSREGLPAETLSLSLRLSLSVEGLTVPPDVSYAPDAELPFHFFNLNARSYLVGQSIRKAEHPSVCGICIHLPFRRAHLLYEHWPRVCYALHTTTHAEISPTAESLHTLQMQIRLHNSLTNTREFTQRFQLSCRLRQQHAIDLPEHTTHARTHARTRTHTRTHTGSSEQCYLPPRVPGDASTPPHISGVRRGGRVKNVLFVCTPDTHTHTHTRTHTDTHTRSNQAAGPRCLQRRLRFAR